MIYGNAGLRLDSLCQLFASVCLLHLSGMSLLAYSPTSNFFAVEAAVDRAPPLRTFCYRLFFSGRPTYRTSGLPHCTSARPWRPDKEAQAHHLPPSPLWACSPLRSPSMVALLTALFLAAKALRSSLPLQFLYSTQAAVHLLSLPGVRPGHYDVSPASPGTLLFSPLTSPSRESPLPPHQGAEQAPITDLSPSPLVQGSAPALPDAPAHAPLCSQGAMHLLSRQAFQASFKPPHGVTTAIARSVVRALCHRAGCRRIMYGL
ncbi:hypothetical protein NDU88_005064 [Pleurodeles waltl]|uniref:Uncharacterized protein n=1 Tax=Pleurodeles waltl TaxID=8319 RepID=A0AAV7QEH9_PLEWA|nr:hypothetical protein NDU88_005064 [Pleurodeles waltl]